MSWGYFADLRLTMPAKTWKELAKKNPDALELKKGWFGCEDSDLEAGFAMRMGGPKQTFAELLDGCKGNESISTVDEVDGEARLRVCLLMDKSELYLARPLALLVEAARTAGGAGALRLVNDGTYSGEGGVAIELQKGKLSRRAIDDDCHEIGEELGMEIFAAAKPKSGKLEKPKINPFTGKPVT